jgi:hypothetical protein
VLVDRSSGSVSNVTGWIADLERAANLPIPIAQDKSDTQK